MPPVAKQVERGSSETTKPGHTKQTRAMTFEKAAGSDGDPKYLHELAAEAGYKPGIVRVWRCLYGHLWARRAVGGGEP